jgi:hypothetical protein
VSANATGSLLLAPLEVLDRRLVLRVLGGELSLLLALRLADTLADRLLPEEGQQVERLAEVVGERPEPGAEDRPRGARGPGQDLERRRDEGVVGPVAEDALVLRSKGDRTRSR